MGKVVSKSKKLHNISAVIREDGHTLQSPDRRLDTITAFFRAKWCDDRNNDRVKLVNRMLSADDISLHFSIEASRSL